MNQRVKKWRQHAGYAAFLLALVFLTTRTCRSQSASSEIRFRVGQAGATLRGLEAELHRPGEQEVLGFYRRDYPQGSGSGAGQWTVRADEGLYRMKIALRTAAGTTKLERGLEIFDGAVVTIDLERDLERDRGAATAPDSAPPPTAR
jgi:hypothetical protein